MQNIAKMKNQLKRCFSSFLTGSVCDFMYFLYPLFADAEISENIP